MTNITIAKIVVHGYLIAAAVGFDHQVVAGAGEHHIGRSRSFETKGIAPVGGVGIIGHRILSVAFGEDVGIGFIRAAGELVVTGTADQGIVTGSAVEGVVAFAAFQPVIAFIAAETIVAGTAQ